jgi:predicted RNA methylase
MNPLYPLIALQLADIVTTIIALRGDAHEDNLIMAKIMDTIGIIPALLIVKCAVVAFLWYFQALIPSEVFWALSAFYCLIVFNNVKVIRK